MPIHIPTIGLRPFHQFATHPFDFVITEHWRTVLVLHLLFLVYCFQPVTVFLSLSDGKRLLKHSHREVIRLLGKRGNKEVDVVIRHRADAVWRYLQRYIVEIEILRIGIKSIGKINNHALQTSSRFLREGLVHHIGAVGHQASLIVVVSPCLLYIFQ